MFKAVLFDADGVILLPRKKYFSDIIAEDYGVPLEQVLPLFKNEFKDCLIGKADLKEVLNNKYLNKWGWRGSAEELLVYWWRGEGQINKPVLDLIKELREKGVRCFLAADQEKYRADHLLKTLELEKFLDGAFISCNMGVGKNNRTFFERILTDLKLEPEEVLFWDDEEENVAVAKELGIDSRLFAALGDFERQMKPYLHRN